MAIKLITELSLTDRDLRNNLKYNFEAIEAALNGIDDLNQQIDKKLATADQKTAKDLSEQAKSLTDRINRILLGTDNESIEQVVTQILKDKGVID